jgi:hypothetical protein
MEITLCRDVGCPSP